MKPDVVDPAVSAGAPDAPAVAAPRLRLDYWLLAATHALVDVFPMIITSLMIVLQDRLALTRWQETAVWVATPVFSGAFQPLFAWLGDRYDTRLAGPVGLAVAALCIGSIGFAQSFGQLIALQIVGVIGVGVYHPAAASVAGQMGTRSRRRSRALAVSVFLAAGMLGHTLGPIFATRVNESFGMAHLAWIIPPSLAMAAVLHVVVRHAPHRPDDHHERRAALSAAQARAHWWAVGLLSLQNALRIIVNLGLYIVLSYWAAWRIRDAPDAAAVLAGNLDAAVTIGMGAGALLGGRLLRPGSERGGFAAVAFGGALCVALLNRAGLWGQSVFDGPLALWPIYVLTTLAAIGFFSTVPPSIGLAQRLLPTHASLVTSLLMGAAWVVGALSRPLSSALLGVGRLDEAATLRSADFDRVFAGFAALLVLAGVLALLMPPRVVRDVARHE